MTTLADFHAASKVKSISGSKNLMFTWPLTQPSETATKFRFFVRWLQRHSIENINTILSGKNEGLFLVLKADLHEPTINVRQALEAQRIVDENKICGQVSTLIIDQFGISGEGVVFGPLADEFTNHVQQHYLRVTPRFLTYNSLNYGTIGVTDFIAIDVHSDGVLSSNENCIIEIIKP